MKKNYLRNLLIFCLFYSFASLYSAQLTVNVNDCDANPAVGQVRVQNDTYNETITLVNGSAGFFIPTGVKNMIANDFSISLQPNPVHEGIVTLKVNKNLPNGSFFHFYNLAGKKLASINPEKENFIEINNAPGIIIFKFIERDNSSRWGKIVLAGNKVQINTQFNSSVSEQNYLKSALSEMSADDYLVSYIDDNGNELLSEMVNMASGADTTIYLNGCCQTLFDNQGGGNNLTGLLFDADHNLSGAIDDDKWSVIDANGKAHMFMYFANTVLAEEGDGIVLKMAYMAGNPAENSLDTLNNDTPNAFRVGLFNNNNTQLASNSGISNAGFAGYTGYYAGFAVKPTVNPQIFERKTQNSLILGDAGNLLGSGTQTGRMTSGKVQTLTFSITKTAAGMDINLTQAGDGGSSMNFTVSDNDNPETTFNSIAIGIDDDPELVGKFYFDYVTVTTCGGEVSVIPKHTLTVNNGSGSDEYVEGKSVCITANASPSGKMFDKWSGTGSAFMTDIEASSVCFAMPGIDIEVTPEYVDLPVGLVIVYDESDNLLSFAAKEITKSFVAKNMTALNCTLSVVSNTLNPDAYTLTENGENNYTVVGTDPSGAMYGGFEIAENLLIGESISTVTRTPYLPKRGIKYNIPLDARNSSYDDSGDAAQENVKNMWDLNGFWKPYLDNLAKNRYNELSLWTCHEFPHMVDFSGTEWAAVNTTYASNVYKVKKGELDANSKGKYIVSTLRADKNTWEQGSIDWAEKDVLPGGVDGDGYVDMDMLERVDGKDGIPDFSNIADKVNHWKAVFEYAEKRGITISIMHWNVYAHGAKGVAGIVESQDDLTFHRYLREAVKRLVNTYPQITTIGVAAGENDHEPEKDGSNAPDYLTERFIYLTYGLGVKDALQDEPEREVKFLWRNHSTENTDVYEQFVKDYDPGKEGLVNVSIKYTVGRLYSSRRPMEWEARAIFHGWLNDDDEEYGINVYPWKVWLNIRNDDAFMHRWGSADYVRLFIRNIPQEYCPGFLLGSDGFVFGREFIYSGTDSVLRNQLEIEKHWYNFGLWGKLAYNNELSDDYWTKVIAWKYGLTYTNAGKLFDAWENVSEIIPQIARQSYTPTDAGIQYEGCMSSWATSTGYITFDRLFLKNDANNYGRWPMQLKEDKVGGERQCWPVRNWVYYNPALTADQISPPEVAQALDDYADNGTSELATLKALNTDNAEYQDMLLDIESMAHLGRFYADKLRCAITWYKFHMAGYDPNDPLFTQAKNEIYAAKAHWEDYAAVLDQHYMPSLTARTNYLDWNGTLNNAPDRTARGKARLVKNGIAREIEAIENIEVGAGQLLELKPQPYDILWGPRWIKENGQGKIYAPWRTTDPL